MRLPARGELPAPSRPAATLLLCLAHATWLEREPPPVQASLLAREQSILEADAFGQAFRYVSQTDFITSRAGRRRYQSPCLTLAGVRFPPSRLA